MATASLAQALTRRGWEVSVIVARSDGIPPEETVGQVRVHRLRQRVTENGANSHIQHDLEQALWRLLRSETSCNFFWSDAWVSRCHQDLNQAWDFLGAAERALGR